MGHFIALKMKDQRNLGILRRLSFFIPPVQYASCLVGSYVSLSVCLRLWDLRCAPLLQYRVTESAQVQSGGAQLYSRGQVQNLGGWSLQLTHTFHQCTAFEGGHKRRSWLPRGGGIAPLPPINNDCSLIQEQCIRSDFQNQPCTNLKSPPPFRW